MELGSLRALALDVNFSAHGVPATITAPDYPDPIDTRVIWLTPANEGMPTGSPFLGTTAIRVAAIRRDAIEKVPIGAVIVAPEQEGGINRSWRVDGHERTEADHHRVYVVLDPDADTLVHE